MFDYSFNPLELIVTSIDANLISRYNIKEGRCIGIGRAKKYILTKSYKEEFDYLTNTTYPINKNYIGFYFSVRQELNTGEKLYWENILKKILNKVEIKGIVV